MKFDIVFLIGGPLLMLMGVVILICRARYAAWWNRVYARRGQRQSFTARLSVVYGFAAFALGAFLLVARGIL